MNTPDDSVPAAAPAQPSSADPATPHAHSVQNQRIAKEIAAAGEMITKALAEPEIVTLLAVRGYGEAELQNGLKLQADAQTGFEAQLAGRGTTNTAKQTRDGDKSSAHDDFVDFRETVQAHYADAATRKALGASGKLTNDRQKFVTDAKAAYAAALKPPYAAELAKRSWTAARLQAATTALNTFATDDAAFGAAKGEATGATGGRNDAVAQLRKWMQEFRKNAKLALKKAPGHRAALGL